MQKQLTKEQAELKIEELIRKRHWTSAKVFNCAPDSIHNRKAHHYKDMELFYRYCEVVNKHIMNLAKVINPEKYGIPTNK